jgi:hypothetical protein
MMWTYRRVISGSVFLGLLFAGVIYVTKAPYRSGRGVKGAPIQVLPDSLKWARPRPDNMLKVAVYPAHYPLIFDTIIIRVEDELLVKVVDEGSGQYSIHTEGMVAGSYSDIKAEAYTRSDTDTRYLLTVKPQSIRADVVHSDSLGDLYRLEMVMSKKEKATYCHILSPIEGYPHATGVILRCPETAVSKVPPGRRLSIGFYFGLQFAASV